MSIEVHLAKVGIGDCILIRMGENARKLNLLIDSGRNEDGYSDTIKYIQDNKENIDYMMITHDDDDHIMGVFESLVNQKEDKSQSEMFYSLFYDNRVFMNYWKKGNETLFDYKK